VPTFGFTGELQDVSAGLVNLRARWYSTARGRFTSVDPFAGMMEQPYSQHQYQYGYSDPVLMTDPSGQCIDGPCLGGNPLATRGDNWFFNWELV
jgi:RHS repeat-associated protein